MGDMADDYAAMIKEEFGGPVDVIGVSAGGSIAQHFAADYPDLVRRLVLHSSAHSLNDDAKRLQLEYARLGGLGQWRAAFRETAEGIPGARLALYEGMGHAAHGKQFHRDVLAFLAEPRNP